MTLTTEIVIVAVLLLVALFIGMLGVKKSGNFVALAQGSGSSFSVAVMSRGIFIMMLSSGALWGDISLSFQRGIQFGFFSNLGFFVLFLIMAYIVGPRLEKESPAISAGDIMQRHYGDIARTASGICSVFACIGYVAVGFHSIALFGERFLALDYAKGLIISTTGLILYTSLGGFCSILKTRTFYTAIILFSLFSLLIIGVQINGGFKNILRALPYEHLSLAPMHGSYYAWIASFLVYALPSMDPGSLQYLFAAQRKHKSRPIFLRAAFWGFFIWMAPTLIGLCLYAKYPNAPVDSVVEIFFKEMIPEEVKGVIYAGILIISISTVDVFLHTASVSLVQDIIAPMLRKKSDPNPHLVRIATAVIGIFCASMLLGTGGFLLVVSKSFSVFCPLIGVPLTLAILGVRGHRASFYMGMCASIATHFVWKSMFEGSDNLDVFLPAAGANLALFLSTEIFIRPFRNPGTFKSPLDKHR